jgi:hypothetical protein
MLSMRLHLLLLEMMRLQILLPPISTVSAIFNLLTCIIVFPLKHGNKNDQGSNVAGIYKIFKEQRTGGIFPSWRYGGLTTDIIHK